MIKTKTDLRTVGNNLHATALLHQLGQSLWLDNITRDLLDQDTLKRVLRITSHEGHSESRILGERRLRCSKAQ